MQPLTFKYIRERRIENEVERTAELQIGRTGASGAGAGTVEEGGSGVTGGVAVVSVQSIESVKVHPSQRIVSYLPPILFYHNPFCPFFSILFFLTQSVLIHESYFCTCIYGSHTPQGGEMLMDALDLVEAELIAIEERISVLKAKSKLTGLTSEEDVKSKNPALMGLTPYKYFARCLREIKAPDLEQALLVIPFHYVARIVPILLKVSNYPCFSLIPIPSHPIPFHSIPFHPIPS